MKRIAFILITFFFPVALLATPAPTGKSGASYTHGSSVVITGTGFLTKSPADPLVWEDFSDGDLDVLMNQGVDTLNNQTDLRTSLSSYNARADFKQASTSGKYFSYNDQTAPRWFVQYWVKLASNWHWGTTFSFSGADDGLANVKFFRMMPSGSTSYSNYGYVHHAGDGIWRFHELNSSDSVESATTLPNALTAGSWHCVQVAVGENSGVDQYDGQIRLWIDGTLIDSSDTVNTNRLGDGEAKNKRPYVIGLYDSWDPSDADVENMYAYYADIYVDSTWSRVMIGNASTYAACTHFEMQPPTAWANDSITVTLNRGSFGATDTAYLYVVDADGAVNANGYEITFGDTEDPAPAPPTLSNVTISNGRVQ